MQALSREQKLFPQQRGHLQLPSTEVESPQSQQHLEALRGISYLPAQLQRPGVGHFYLWRGVAFGMYQGNAQGDLEIELPPVTFWCFGHGPEQRQRAPEVGYCLLVGVPLARLLPGSLQIVAGLLPYPCSLKVPGQLDRDLVGLVAI